MEREVRYCTTADGVRIAYCIEGEGPPLVVGQQLVESFSVDHIAEGFREFYRALAQRRAVVRYDIRGTGLSDRGQYDMSGESLIKDVEAVVGSVNNSPVSLLGDTISGQRMLLFAYRHPELVDRLTLFGAFACGSDVMPEASLRALTTLARSNWHFGAQAIADTAGRVEFPEATAAIAEMYRESASGDVVADLMEQAYATDLSAILAQITTPTLVIHRRRDPIIPFATGQLLAASIPGAKFVTFDEAQHAAQIGNSSEVIAAIDSFVPARQEEGKVAGSAAGAFRTVLFTDLVAHTEMMSRLGDEHGREVLREHDRIIREMLKAHGGTEVKTMGDGFMASFGSVTRAVDCAVALQRAFIDRNQSASEPLHVRVGLNAGEPVEEEGDLYGASVIMAARIAAQAGPGEILIPEPVRHLLAGKGFLLSVLVDFESPGGRSAMRALLFVVGLLACFLYAGPSLTGNASADAPNLDDDVRTISATATYRLSPTLEMTVGGGELVSHSTNTKEYFAGVAILSSAGGSFVDLVDASALFDSLPLHGGVNEAKLDVTLPVTYCVLDSCPTTLEVSLVWQSDAKPTRDSSSTRIDTDSCHFTDIRQSSNATAVVTGFVSDGTSNLASGQTSGTVSEDRERLVGFGDAAVCLPLAHPSKGLSLDIAADGGLTVPERTSE